MDFNLYSETPEVIHDVQKAIEEEEVIADETIDLGHGMVVSKRILLRAASFVQRRAYQFYGEVSFRLRPDKKEETVGSEHYEPLTFLRSLGYQRNQAKEILLDPIIFTNIYIILKEARLWTQSLEHYQATLLFEAADKISRGRRAAEYIAIVTDAVISGNIPGYDELLAFTRFVEGVEEGKFSWHQIIPLSSRKEIKNIPHMLHQYEVEKVFMDTYKLVKQLREKDDKLLLAITDLVEADISKSEGVAEPYQTPSSSTSSIISEEMLALSGASPLDHRLLKARRVISAKEVTKQCCIFANYYDPSMYYYVPLVAHMIARGYFTIYIQIQAVVDYLRPICGMRQVKLVEVLNVVINVSNVYPQESANIPQVLITHKLLTGQDEISSETIVESEISEKKDDLSSNSL